MFCNKCGSKLISGAVFCSVCGAPRAGTAGQRGTAPVARPSARPSARPMPRRPAPRPARVSPPSALNKAGNWLKANKGKALIIAAALVVLIIVLANMGGGLSGTWVSEDGVVEIRFSGSSFTISIHHAHQPTETYEGKYSRIDGGYRLSAQGETLFAVKHGRNLMVSGDFLGEMLFRKKSALSGNTDAGGGAAAETPDPEPDPTPMKIIDFSNIIGEYTVSFSDGAGSEYDFSINVKSITDTTIHASGSIESRLDWWTPRERSRETFFDQTFLYDVEGDTLKISVGGWYTNNSSETHNKDVIFREDGAAVASIEMKKIGAPALPVDTQTIDFSNITGEYIVSFSDGAHYNYDFSINIASITDTEIYATGSIVSWFNQWTPPVLHQEFVFDEIFPYTVEGDAIKISVDGWSNYTNSETHKKDIIFTENGAVVIADFYNYSTLTWEHDQSFEMHKIQ